ncbi:MAG: hypothetical protein KQ78_01813 [Candidatus Izimaplasma bacterium HR2]|nr:MAG: hypothetical protein KQ78_01813 [Candidatus Izimaplasma bacterium HR2]
MNINFEGDFDYLEIFDENDNKIYFEESDGYWVKFEYDENSNLIFKINSNGVWAKFEFDECRKEIYYEDSDGVIRDDRKHIIIIDGKTIKLSKESFEELKKQLI